MTNEEKINLIGRKIAILSNNLEKYQAELNLLRLQLESLQQDRDVFQSTASPSTVIVTPELNNEISIANSSSIVNETKKEIPTNKIGDNFQTGQQPYNFPLRTPKPASDFNFEAFVGGKLITIIGIVILVIGLGIGVKYAIDNELLGPLARIVLAYAAGAILLVLAFRLKGNYKTFSAVLLSGGMASLYFTTFIGYSMYYLFPQGIAFGIMVLFTCFTVFAATIYELEIIGIIGLAGAYAVPMLLSDGSGNIRVMFIYMAIINTGILVLSFKKHWQVLNHIAFALTWLIVGIWFTTKFDYELHTPMILCFSFLFFLIFYISNMAYKILKHEQFVIPDIIRLVSNSFIFFGIGYAALNNEGYEQYLGVFTVANAIVHFIFSYIVFKNKLIDRKLFYLLIALVLTFITIAVPVQLEGNWVTLFWSAEAVLLFSIGRYKSIRFYEWLGYIMVLPAMGSLWQDWTKVYYTSVYDYGIYKFLTPFANIYFFTSLFVIASFALMIFVQTKKGITDDERKRFKIYRIIEYILPALLLLIIYNAFSNEIASFYQLRYNQSFLKVQSKETTGGVREINEIYDYSILKLKEVMLDIYALFFFSVLTFLSIYKWKSKAIRWAAFGLAMLTSILFVLNGLNQLSGFRDISFESSTMEYYGVSSSLSYIRYVSFTFFGLLLYSIHLLLNTEAFKKFSISKIYSGCIVHFFILIILCNELVNINYLRGLQAGGEDYVLMQATFKLGFTAIWGIYSFVLIAFGIFKQNKIVRISAISLFGITLIKLVIFDTWDLSTGYKVIAYMLLGVILLVVAFLYQKFKTFIFGDDQQEKKTGE